jgi:hypothetical protein
MPPLPSACVRFVALVVAGLCLLGADFARPDPASFALGSTTEAEIRQRFGNPYGQTTSRVGDRVVTTLQYTYAEPRTGVIPARAMTYSFYDGRLVGFDYSSSFGADETAFDEKVVKRIKRGETTRTEVLAIAGPPTGQFIYPTPQATVPGRRAYVYGYSRSERLAPATLETANKVLTITFDDHDVVAELSLVMTTISRPLPSGDRS